MPNRQAFTLIEMLVIIAIFLVICMLVVASSSSLPARGGQSQYVYGTHIYAEKLQFENHDYIVTNHGSICHSASCNAKH